MPGFPSTKRLSPPFYFFGSHEDYLALHQKAHSPTSGCPPRTAPVQAALAAEKGTREDNFGDCLTIDGGEWLKSGGEFSEATDYDAKI